MNRHALAVAAVFLWVAAIALGAGTVIAGSGPDPATKDGTAIPVLSDAERAEAARLAHAELDALIGPGRVAVRDVGVWHTHGKHKLGAVVVASATDSGPFRAQWPTIDYDRSETSEQGYADDEAEYTAAHVREFLVLVDLRRDRVVQVEPNGADVEITNPAGELRRRNTPRGD